MLTKTLSEAKKKQRNILIKAMNNDIGSIDSAKDSWNPAQISERAKDISYIRSLVDSWNPAQLNEALKMLDLPVIDTWNPAQIEEQRRNLVFYLVERTLTGNPITLKILGNLTPEVTNLKVTMNPIQDLSHGDPSPTNICPISGRTEVNVYQYTEQTETPETTYTSTFGQTVYGGTLDVLSGVLTVDRAIVTYDGSSSENWSSSEVRPSKFRHTVILNNGQPSNVAILSNEFKGIPYNSRSYDITGIVWASGNDNLLVVMSDLNETAFKSLLSSNNLQVVYELATPTTISTSAEEITLLKGTNVLSTDGDSIELKYKQNF